MARLFFPLLFAGIFMFTPSVGVAEDAPQDSTADIEAVRAAVLDYVEGLYDMAPERIERSVHPQLAKVGWKRDRQGVYRQHPLTYEQLVRGSATYNADGHLPADPPKEITIYEVLDKTASVQLVASWGIDFMLLVKLDGQWKIRSVLWQGHPLE